MASLYSNELKCKLNLDFRYSGGFKLEQVYRVSQYLQIQNSDDYGGFNPENGCISIKLSLFFSLVSIKKESNLYIMSISVSKSNKEIL